jgi:nicotinate phosphoribosyltransferase
MATATQRQAPEVFRLPVEKIRSGYYSDSYFVLTKELLEGEGRHPRVTMQVFAKREGLLGGIDEAIAILRLGAGRKDGTGWRDGWPQLRVQALNEGDRIGPWETVLRIEGDYSLFTHLETVYLGTLSRRSLVMTNVRRVVEVARGKPILFFPARHDHWLAQTGDGWAAHVAGAIGVSTDAQASWWGGRGVGTVPHALIAAYGRDTVTAARDFCRRFGDEINIVVLADFHNDSVAEAVAVAEALDNAGHEQVHIVASGGFDAEKIERFEERGAPVDSYGVGSALLRGGFDFTADVVELDGRPGGKAGRELRPNPRLREVD